MTVIAVPLAWVSELDSRSQTVVLLMSPADAELIEDHSDLTFSFSLLRHRMYMDGGPILQGADLYEMP